ncbi:hypothetical protein PENTCL1PPCAC_22127 [Pristionchus entomophagus]|uniref:Uncharacterized protein n=1 Tax=Pristionchus entomophagus TaxID=358040 RepID=A0AAV5U0G6_9BILA|nr:hypothetical protein PENTCL1PPCAC_22127 [Pristionchus entomophagus]
MAGRMPPSTSAHDNPPAAAAASTDAAVANYARLQQWIERECTECDAAIDEHRKQVAEYRTQKGRLLELQKKISHPIMVPFGSVGFMPGKLVRTNEVLVLLGANYFAECSVHDTGKIIDRRIREINSLIDKLEHQKRNASERLNFAQGLFGGATGGKDGLIEIREEYDEEKEAEAMRKRIERAAASRAEKKVPQAAFEDVMSRLDELEKQEKAEERKPLIVRREAPDSDDETEEEEEYVEHSSPPPPPRGVDEEEYKRLLARLDQVDTTSEEEEEEESDDVIEEDSDDVSDTEERKIARVDEMRKQREAEERMKMIERERRERERSVAPQPRRRLIEVIEDNPAPTTVAPPAQSIIKQKPKMTVVSENDRVVDLVEYQNQQDEEDKAKENTPSSKGSSKLTHKRSVRFKKGLEAGPCEKSFDSVDSLDVLPVLDGQINNPRSILRNKSEESPIDKIAFSEMEDQRSTTILPAGDAFSGCVVERSAELPIVFKPVDEPPRRVSRFKLQRMQQATE